CPGPSHWSLLPWCLPGSSRSVARRVVPALAHAVRSRWAVVVVAQCRAGRQPRTLLACATGDQPRAGDGADLWLRPHRAPHHAAVSRRPAGIVRRPRGARAVGAGIAHNPLGTHKRSDIANTRDPDAVFALDRPALSVPVLL